MMKTLTCRLLMVCFTFGTVLNLQTTNALAASSGCESVARYNGSYTINVWGDFGYEDEYFAGDTITLTADNSDGNAHDFELDVLGDSPSGVFLAQKVGVPGSISYTFPKTGTFLVIVVLYGSGTVNLAATSTCSQATNVPAGNLLDGRINHNQSEDVAAPVAIYHDDALDIYAIDPDTSAGTLLIRLTQADLDAAGEPNAAENILIIEAINPFTGQSISIWRLTTGEVQLNTFYADGKPYVIAWPVSAPENLYHLDG